MLWVVTGQVLWSHEVEHSLMHIGGSRCVAGEVINDMRVV